MKAYITTTAAIFGLLTFLHIWRATVERQLATEPWYILITITAAALCLWGLGVEFAWRRPRP